VGIFLMVWYTNCRDDNTFWFVHNVNNLLIVHTVHHESRWTSEIMPVRIVCKLDSKKGALILPKKLESVRQVYIVRGRRTPL
jgi:hypothetical protein